MKKVIDSLFSMDIFLVDPSKRLMNSTSKIALEKVITIYDATYVSLSKQFSTILVTSDKKLYNKTKDSYEVQILQELNLGNI